ncbi:hypothetical protein F4803DRAFT_234652 [Xylaria telfairii]|nr:hypothetical protein F4803DRAFT_234652 [Xylaria telfairii]
MERALLFRLAGLPFVARPLAVPTATLRCCYRPVIILIIKRFFRSNQGGISCRFYRLQKKNQKKKKPSYYCYWGAYQSIHQLYEICDYLSAIGGAVYTVHTYAGGIQVGLIYIVGTIQVLGFKN